MRARIGSRRHSNKPLIGTLAITGMACATAFAQESFWTADLSGVGVGPSRQQDVGEPCDNPHAEAIRLLESGHLSAAERQLRTLLDPTLSSYVHTVQLLALCLVQQGRPEDAMSELESGIANRPDSLDIKVLGYEILRDVIDNSDLVPTIAAKLGAEIATLSAVDPIAARRASRRVVAATIEPELLVPLMRAAMGMASHQAPAYASPLFEDYFDYLRESAMALDRAVAAVRYEQWDTARAQFDQAAEWADDAAPGYPNQAAVLKPMLKAAAGASAMLSGQVGLAQDLCQEGMTGPMLPQQQAALYTVLAMCSELRETPFDRAATASQSDHGAAEAAAWQAQAASATSSLPTQMYIDFICNNMLWGN